LFLINNTCQFIQRYGPFGLANEAVQKLLYKAAFYIIDKRGRIGQRTEDGNRQRHPVRRKGVCDERGVVAILQRLTALSQGKDSLHCDSR